MEMQKNRISQMEEKQLLRVEEVRDAIKLRLAKAEAAVIAKNHHSKR